MTFPVTAGQYAILLGDLKPDFSAHLCSTQGAQPGDCLLFLSLFCSNNQSVTPGLTNRARAAILCAYLVASVAQLVEQLTLNQLVLGSSPSRGTNTLADDLPEVVTRLAEPCRILPSLLHLLQCRHQERVDGALQFLQRQEQPPASRHLQFRQAPKQIQPLCDLRTRPWSRSFAFVGWVSLPWHKACLRRSK